MARFTKSGRLTRRLAITLAASSASVMAACSADKPAVSPVIPGLSGPAAAVKPVAFIADVDIRKGIVKISSPSKGTVDQASLSLFGAAGGPNLSLLGGEAVRLIPSNFQASAVGAFIPGKVRVTFDVTIENKLPGINFITPTWPVPPSPGVILIPLEQVVTTTPGGTTGGDGNDVIVELPSYGQVVASIDWNGTGTAGSGSPFNFFNDADCGLATSNDCFRWRSYTSPVLASPATSEPHNIGFDLDPTVGQFRARMIVAADLAPSAPAAPSTVQGVVSSPARGPLNGVTVNVAGGFTGSTNATGSYSIGNVAPGSRSVSVSTLPAGCTAPAAQTIAVAPGSTNTVNFTVDCTGLPGTIGGTVTRSNDGSTLSGVTVTASAGGSNVTNATGVFSIASVPSGAGTLLVSGAPSECTPAPVAYTLPSGGNITQNIVVTCGAAPQPGYQYQATWVSLGANQFALDLVIDMRTFNRADITDITTSGNTGDPLTGAQLSLVYDQSRLSFVGSENLTGTIIQSDPAVNGGTPGVVSVLAGTTTLKTGNVGIVRLLFSRVAASPAGSVTTTTNFTNVTSRTGTTTVVITANVVKNEGTLVLP